MKFKEIKLTNLQYHILLGFGRCYSITYYNYGEIYAYNIVHTLGRRLFIDMCNEENAFMYRKGTFELRSGDIKDLFTHPNYEYIEVREIK